MAKKIRIGLIGDYNPEVKPPLTCSLIDARGTIQLLPNTRISNIYNKSETVESYFCNFGLNPEFRSLLEQSEMHITGVDENGEARVIELAHHPFLSLHFFSRNSQHSQMLLIRSPLLSYRLLLIQIPTIFSFNQNNKCRHCSLLK